MGQTDRQIAASLNNPYHRLGDMVALAIDDMVRHWHFHSSA